MSSLSSQPQALSTTDWTANPPLAFSWSLLLNLPCERDASLFLTFSSQIPTTRKVLSPPPPTRRALSDVTYCEVPGAEFPVSIRKHKIPWRTCTFTLDCNPVKDDGLLCGLGENGPALRKGCTCYRPWGLKGRPFPLHGDESPLGAQKESLAGGILFFSSSWCTIITSWSSTRGSLH